MKCLLKFLRYELEFLEQVYKHDGLKENNTHDNKQLQSGRKGTATSLLTSQNKETCLFCEGFHKTELCDANVLLSKKKEVLKRKARCYRCTKRNHNSRDCRNKSIFCENCKGRHVTTMWDPEWLKRSKSITSNDQSTNVNSTNEKAVYPSISTLMTNNNTNVLLQTACTCAGRIKLKGQYSEDIVTVEAVEVPEICLDNFKVPNECAAEFNNIQLTDQIPNGINIISGISVLIGADYYWKIVTGKTIRLNERLMAINTRFGYTIHGPVPVDSSCVSTNFTSVLHASVYSDESRIERMWDLESVGIKGDSNEDNDFLNDFASKCIKRDDCRYQVALNWKPYVANCVREIQMLTNNTQGWYHDPGSDNLVDLLTRSITANVLIHSKLWQVGPEWLSNVKEWPTQRPCEDAALLAAATSLTVSLKSDSGNIQKFIDIDKFNNYQRLVWVAAYVLRFVNNAKRNRDQTVGYLNNNGKPGTMPSPPLPKDRITKAKALQVTGLDFAGPLYVKENKREKGYVILFTFDVTRAIQFELDSNLRTETSLLALGRFMVQHEVPRIIHSDNAKTFKRAAGDFQEF
ncbi:hypothetical protein ILUMI_14123, partial [Ignelater luminosus]